VLYEIREYTSTPGHLRDLIVRFNEATLRLFRQHGFDLVFIAQTEIGERSNTELVYVLRWDSYAAAEQGWAALLSDPEFLAAVKASESGGPTVQQLSRRFLNSTAFVQT
jgi:heme-degrading monooxygenase HmoA